MTLTKMSQNCTDISAWRIDRNTTELIRMVLIIRQFGRLFLVDKGSLYLMINNYANLSEAFMNL